MNILRVLCLGVIILCSFNSYSQKENINNYKYIIVPEGYSFLNENDKFQLNSLSKFLFKKYGFNAFFLSEGLPEEIKTNGCIALRADVSKNSGLFLTKLFVELKDCNGKVVFTSSEGTSRQKEYKKAYQEALRQAFLDIKALNYKYSGDDNIIVNKSLNNATGNTTKAVASQQLPKSVQNSSVGEKEVSSKPILTALNYDFNGKQYVFTKQEYGYEISLVDTSESIGKVIKTNRDNNYIVKAGNLSGNGYFDAYSNFVLERINPVNNKVITDTFARQ